MHNIFPAGQLCEDCLMQVRMCRVQLGEAGLNAQLRQFFLGLALLK